jgi:hypothetical protein
MHYDLTRERANPSFRDRAGLYLLHASLSVTGVAGGLNDQRNVISEGENVSEVE